MAVLKRIIDKSLRYYQHTILQKGIVNKGQEGFINLIDVGSIGGLPDPWYLNANFLNKVLKFEPRDDASFDANTITIDVALWNENCEKDFFIFKGNKGHGSSLFPQNIEYVSENFQMLRARGNAKAAITWLERSTLDKIIKIHCRRLDDIIDELEETIEFHFMKIDAQGAEYQILQGAEKLLSSSCIGLHLELFTIPLYKGITLLPEIVNYLEKYDFELVWKSEPIATFDAAHDCLFLKVNARGEIMNTIRRLYKL